MIGKSARTTVESRSLPSTKRRPFHATADAQVDCSSSQDRRQKGPKESHHIAFVFGIFQSLYLFVAFVCCVASSVVFAHHHTCRLLVSSRRRLSSSKAVGFWPNVVGRTRLETAFGLWIFRDENGIGLHYGFEMEHKDLLVRRFRDWHLRLLAFPLSRRLAALLFPRRVRRKKPAKPGPTRPRTENRKTMQ